MKKRLIIIGSNSQIGVEYQMSYPINNWDMIFLCEDDIDITSPKNIVDVFNDLYPDAILNLLEYNNIELAEKIETEKAFNINAIGPKNLAIACSNFNIPIIHISTSHVFDGTSKYTYNEKDLENPVTQYGRTKFLGEKWIQENSEWYYIIRTSWIFCNNTENFYTDMLALAEQRSEIHVDYNQIGSPTSSREICKGIDKILKSLDKNKSGIYNFSCIGEPVTLKEFAVEIFKQSHICMIINYKYGDNLSKYVNYSLNMDKFVLEFNYMPPHWKNSLGEILGERKIIPIKVGDLVNYDDREYIIVSTDWSSRIAVIANPTNFEEIKEISFDVLVL